MKTNTFLIRATSGREAVMRLPIGRYGAITQKGRDIIGKRFYEGGTNTKHNMKYALNLEAFSNGKELAEAIEKYNKNIL